MSGAPAAGPQHPAGGREPETRIWRTNDRTSFGLFLLVIATVLWLVLRATTFSLFLAAIGAVFTAWGLYGQFRERRRNEFRG